MTAKNIVVGQKVSPDKIVAAKRLRKEMTGAERNLWEHLRRNQLCNVHFRRQQIIRGFVVDFYCHQAGLVVELDGRIHEKSREADTERQACLEGLGLKVIRFTNEDVFHNIEGVLMQIMKELSTCGEET